MQIGDVFTLDNDAIVEMENNGFSVVWKDKAKNEFRLNPGAEFRIANLTGLPVELRASKIDSVTGKAGRGRPRRFPPQVVARLLGETWDPQAADLSTASDDAPAASDVGSVSSQIDVVAPAPVLDIEEETEEDREARETRVSNLLGLIDDDSNEDDWV